MHSFHWVEFTDSGIGHSISLLYSTVGWDFKDFGWAGWAIKKIETWLSAAEWLRRESGVHSASVNSCDINRVLLPMAHRSSLSVGRLHGHLHSLLRWRSPAPNTQVVRSKTGCEADTLSRQSLMSGSFGDHDISRRQGKKKQVDYKLCLHTHLPSAILSSLDSVRGWWTWL